MGPSKVGDIVTPPGPWMTCGWLSRGCSQQHLPHQSILEHSGRMAESKYSSCDLSIRRKSSLIGFYKNIAAAHFFVKCHSLKLILKNSISAACISDSILSHHPKCMTMSADRNKDWFMNWQLCSVWKLPFVATNGQSSRKTAFALSIRVSVSCSVFRHSWILLQVTWTSPPTVVYCCLLALSLIPGET